LPHWSSVEQPSARTVAVDRQTNLTTHGESNACRIGGFAPEYDERRTIDALAPLEQRLEFSAGGQPL
jgi:hypothetical protein